MFSFYKVPQNGTLGLLQNEREGVRGRERYRRIIKEPVIHVFASSSSAANDVRKLVNSGA